MPIYEGMFLIEPTVATKEWDKVQDEIQRFVGKASGKVVSTNKWGERKLAYPIRGLKRGSYLLAYIDMDGGGAATIRRECDLSDMILRVLIVRHEGPIKECVAPQELPPPDATRTGGFRRPRRY